MIKISQLKSNPGNPRHITDAAYLRLRDSVQAFPDMLSKRPLVVVTDPLDGKLYPLGGNQRLRALKDLGYKELPAEWVCSADEWSEDRRREFTIKDNVSSGAWDADALQTDWEASDLEAWGITEDVFADTAETLIGDTAENLTDLSGDIKSSFEVIVRCDDEKHQELVYNKLIGEGFDVRVLTL